MQSVLMNTLYISLAVLPCTSIQLKNLQQRISVLEDNLGEARMKEIAGDISTEQVNTAKTLWINEVLRDLFIGARRFPVKKSSP